MTWNAPAELCSLGSAVILEMKRIKRIALILLSVTIFTALGFIILRALSRSWEQKLIATKSVRELTGTVQYKGYRKYEKVNAERVENGQYFYRNQEGELIQRYPGDEDWLIFYRIDHFAPTDEPMSTRLLNREKERVANGKLRVASASKEQYDQIQAGDKIRVL